jgi:hypothetical protein
VRKATNNLSKQQIVDRIIIRQPVTVDLLPVGHEWFLYLSLSILPSGLREDRGL